MHEDHPLLVVRDYYSSYTEAVSSIHNPRSLHAMVTGTHLIWSYILIVLVTIIIIIIIIIITPLRS
jgi:type IV secretory pathway component VirB8